MKKNNLFLNFTLLSFLIVISASIRAQDPTFTQFYANPVYLNPAFAGADRCPKITLNYRNEWPNLSGNYVTYCASYDVYSKNIKGGLGLIAMHDQQGQATIQTTMVGGIYSYNLKVNNKFYIMFGVKASYFQKFLDWDKLTFGDMIDPRRGFIYQTGDVPRGGRRGFFDATAGIVGFGKNYYFGVAANHLNRPNESMILGDSKLPIRLTAHIGSIIPLGKKLNRKSKTTISPNIIYQYQNGFQELNIGTSVTFGLFSSGVWYRSNDAFIVNFGIVTDKFKMGYSYDLTVSKLSSVSGGSHEVSMGIFLPCKVKAKSWSDNPCPKF